jgi:cardiolipin synthase
LTKLITTGARHLNRISLNVPNVLTLFRSALVPVTVILIFYGLTMAAFATYVVACATDLLDGVIARKFNMITEEGILLDPLADKLMAVFVIVAFVSIGVVPAFILIILLIKEALMIGGGVFLYYRKIVTPSNAFGKIATVILNTAMGFAFFYKQIDAFWPVPPFLNWHSIFLSFALLMMIVALFQYAYFNMFRKFRNQRKEEKLADKN